MLSITTENVFYRKAFTIEVYGEKLEFSKLHPLDKAILIFSTSINTSAQNFFSSCEIV